MSDQPFSTFCARNPQRIRKLVDLLVPGLTSTVFSLPPLPTSPTENPNTLIAIPLPPDHPPPSPSATPDLPSSVDLRPEEAITLYGGVPFISRTFSHACLSRAPGDVNRMYSAFNTFQAPVSGEEKKRRLQERIARLYLLFSFLLVDDSHLTAEPVGNKDPAQYLLTVEQMIENDYPVPCSLTSYRVFKKPDGWIETAQAAIYVVSDAQTVYAMGCKILSTSHPVHNTNNDIFL